MKYAAEMSSGAMIYIPGFIKIGSPIQKLLGWGEIHREHADRICLLSVFQNKEIGLKRGGVEDGLTNHPPLDSCIETNEVTANYAEQANDEPSCRCTTLPPPSHPSQHAASLV
jgi:hypothetical protein